MRGTLQTVQSKAAKLMVVRKLRVARKIGVTVAWKVGVATRKTSLKAKRAHQRMLENFEG